MMPVRFLTVAVMALGLALLPACRPAGDPAAVKAPTRPIEQVLSAHAPRLMAMTGVTAVGQGELSDHRPCIRVFLLAHDAELERRIPKSIEGYPVDVQVTGAIRAQPDSTP